MKENELKNGDVYIAFVRYGEDINKDNPRGKVRPVVIFEDPAENKLFACKVSSRIDKPTEKKLGYIIQDWKEAGFKKTSVVACNRENIREIDKMAIHQYVGRLTERDIKGMLIKHIRVTELEFSKKIEQKEPKQQGVFSIQGVKAIDKKIKEQEKNQVKNKDKEHFTER